MSPDRLVLHYSTRYICQSGCESGAGTCSDCAKLNTVSFSLVLLLKTWCFCALLVYRWDSVGFVSEFCCHTVNPQNVYLQLREMAVKTMPFHSIQLWDSRFSFDSHKIQNGLNSENMFCVLVSIYNTKCKQSLLK